MNETKINAVHGLRMMRAACLLTCSWFMVPLAQAGEIQSLSWVNNADRPTLEVRGAGDAA